jgi:hypothetical protein
VIAAKAFRLSPQAVESAIDHLCRYGDTDVFPQLPELAFLQEQKTEIVAEIAGVDLDVLSPDGALEALAPKSTRSFRIAHLLPALEALILLSCVIEIGEKIESYRQPANDVTVFAYRFELGTSGQIYSPRRSFRSWLEAQQKFIDDNGDVTQVLFTDVSDFYSRVSHHRLFDNLLETCASGHGAVRFLKSHMKRIRARQSFGLPVGGSAARLLAELALSDTDSALVGAGIKFTRFVDDYRIFLNDKEDSYDVLALLAENLGINEGLSLNSAKTRTLTRGEFESYIQDSVTDVQDKATGEALDRLVGVIYFDDDPDGSELEKLAHINLVQMLEEALKEDEVDFNRVRVIFRALKITKAPAAVGFINDTFRN